MALDSFIFGGGTGDTPQTLARKRKVAEALMVKAGGAPKNVGEGLSAVGNALLYRSLMKKVDAGQKEADSNAAMDYNALFGGSAPQSVPGQTGGNMPKVDQAGNVAPVDIADGDVFTPFMDTVKTGIQNPYALAAVAATGNAESRFSPGNVNRTWSDPSESGEAGTAGGIMSWRGPRYQALAATGDLSPAGQAKFFLQENPQLIEALNKAGSVDEAQSLMNNAWKFAGYDRAGGEAGRRLTAANAYLPQFQGQPTEVASLDPSSVKPGTAAEAIQEQAPLPVGESLADEAAAFRQTPEYAAQFPGQTPQGSPRAALPVDQAQSAVQQPAVNPQVAQALMKGDRSGGGSGGNVPGAGYFPAQPSQAGQSGPSMQQLMQAAANPNMNDGQRAVVNALLKQKIDQNNPDNQLNTEFKRAQIDALKTKPTKEWQKLSDTTLFNPQTGETKDLTAPGPDGKKAFRFGGNSVEAQSLNGLMDSKVLTPDQAQQLGAGKTITGPDGEIIFMTPQGVFGKPANGGEAKPIMGGQTQADPAQAVPDASGNIVITKPKVKVDEKNAMTFADRMATSGAIIDAMGMEGSGKADRLLSGVPLVGDYLTSDEYKKVDAAKRDFINAQLRRESGAAIGQGEFDNAEIQYFPQPNDPPEVIEQKRKLRKQVIEGMVRDAGPTYTPPVIEDTKNQPARRKFNPATGELE